MKERPILFSGPMVTAILEGRKTMTRRVLKPQPNEAWSKPPIWIDSEGYWNCGTGSELATRSDFRCPYGKPGDVIWVRETWRPESDFFETMPSDGDPANVSEAFDIRYTTDPTQQYWHSVPKDERKKYTRAFERLIDGQSERWHPSIHMPRWASRITLEIESVRVERLQDISEEDARAEGALFGTDDVFVPPTIGSFIHKMQGGSYLSGFKTLWDKINGKKHPWSSNPWVWVIQFKKI